MFFRGRVTTLPLFFTFIELFALGVDQCLVGTVVALWSDVAIFPAAIAKSGFWTGRWHVGRSSGFREWLLNRWDSWSIGLVKLGGGESI